MFVTHSACRAPRTPTLQNAEPLWADQREKVREAPGLQAQDSKPSLVGKVGLIDSGDARTDYNDIEIRLCVDTDHDVFHFPDVHRNAPSENWRMVRHARAV